MGPPASPHSDPLLKTFLLLFDLVKKHLNVFTIDKSLTQGAIQEIGRTYHTKERWGHGYGIFSVRQF